MTSNLCKWGVERSTIFIMFLEYTKYSARQAKYTSFNPFLKEDFPCSWCQIYTCWVLWHKLKLNTICVDKSTTHLCIGMTKHTNWEGEYSIGPWKWAELSRTAYLNTRHHNIAIMQLQLKRLHATSTYLKTTFIVTLFVQGRIQVIRKVFIGDVEE